MDEQEFTAVAAPSVAPTAPDYDAALPDDTRPGCYFMTKAGEADAIVHRVSVEYMLTIGWALKPKG